MSKMTPLEASEWLKTQIIKRMIKPTDKDIEALTIGVTAIESMVKIKEKIGGK